MYRRKQSRRGSSRGTGSGYGKMPLDPEMAAAVDAGQFAGVVNTYLGDVEKYLP